MVTRVRRKIPPPRVRREIPPLRIRRKIPASRIRQQDYELSTKFPKYKMERRRVSRLINWKDSVKNTFDKLLSGECKSDAPFEKKYTKLFTDMSSKGIIVEASQLGEISDNFIKRNYISFSVPIKPVQFIANRLKHLNIFYIIRAHHLDSIDDNDYGTQISSHMEFEGNVVIYTGKDTDWSDLNSIPGNISESAKITRPAKSSIDINFRKMDREHYESVDPYNILTYDKSIVTDCLENDLNVEFRARIEGNIATITVFDARWKTGSYVFDEIRKIVRLIPTDMTNFNIGSVERFENVKISEEKEDVTWYSECSNEQDPILLENFAHLEEKDVIKIFLGDNRKGECYVTNQLLRFWRDPEIVMRNWVRAVLNVPIDKSGFGGKPGIEKYWQLPLTGSLITSSTVEIILQRPRTLRLKIKTKNQLIGNSLGSFGASKIHGQSPGVIIWKEKPQKEIFRNVVETISAGGEIPVAIRDNGTLVSWGDNSSFQMFDTPDGSDFIQVSAGGHHLVALRESGNIISWGHNGLNQVSNTPEGSDFIQVSAGTWFSTALKHDGTLVSWGDNHTNQISDTPEDFDFIQVSSGGYHSIALRDDGTLVGWGSEHLIFNTPEDSDFIQVSTGQAHSVALRESGNIISWGHNGLNQVSDTPEDSDFIQVSAGRFHSVALRENGSLVSWGDNGFNQVSDTPNGSDFIQVSAGKEYSVALREDGTLVSWGNNKDNQVSDTPRDPDFRVSQEEIYRHSSISSQEEIKEDISEISSPVRAISRPISGLTSLPPRERITLPSPSSRRSSSPTRIRSSSGRIRGRGERYSGSVNIH